MGPAPPRSACRAAARYQLGNLLGAVEDCEAALRLEPSNRQAATDRAQWAAELLAKEGLPAPRRFEPLPLVVVGAPPAAGAVAASAGPSGDALIKEVSSVPRRASLAAAAGEESVPLAAAPAEGPAEASAAAALPMATIQVLGSGGSKAADEDSEELPDLPAEAFELPKPGHTQPEQQGAQQTAGQPMQVGEQQQPQQQGLVQLERAVSPQAEHQEQQQQQTPAAAPAVVMGEQVATPATREAAAPAAQLAAAPPVQPVTAASPVASGQKLATAPQTAATAAPLKVPRTGETAFGISCFCVPQRSACHPSPKRP